MKNKMLLMLIVFIVSSQFVFAGGIGQPSKSSSKKEYWIDKDVTVLAFVDGDKIAKFKTFERQRIKLLHKRSGGGQYAFHLYGLVVYDVLKQRKMLIDEGFFLYSKRKVRTFKYKRKIPMKYKTKKGDYNDIIRIPRN